MSKGEAVVLFELAGSLQRRDQDESSTGKFSVIVKKNGPMPYAGRWLGDNDLSETSLGFSASDLVAEVLFAAVDQGFNPSGINVNLENLLRMTDIELREILRAANIPLDSSW